MGARRRALGLRAVAGARTLLGVLVAGAVLGVPAVSRACAVCTAGRDEENAAAFLLSTIGMSLMPLVAIGTLVFVLWRRIQKLEAENEAAREAAPTAVPSRSH